jgi:hypothetical protein
MKNLPPLFALVTASLLLTTPGCSDDRPKETLASSGLASHAPAPTATAAPAPIVPEVAPVAVSAASDPFAEILITLQNITPEQNAGLTAVEERMERGITEQVSIWRAARRTATGTGEGKLTNARADFAGKIRALSFAGPDTWAAAKSTAILSLQNLRAAYDELAAAPPRS